MPVNHAASLIRVLGLAILIVLSGCTKSDDDDPAPGSTPDPDPISFNIPKLFDGAVHAIVLAGDGSGDLIVGGSFAGYGDAASAGLIRLNEDGSVDRVALGAGFNGDVLALAPATDGSGDLFAAGAFTAYGGTNSERIVRVNGDLSVDTVAQGFGFNAEVRAMAVDPGGAGDLFVGGDFTTYNGLASGCIVRLNGNLSMGTSAAGTGFSPGTVHSILLTADGTGDVFAGGDFFDYNGTASGSIIRLNANLTLDTPAVGSGFGGGGTWVRAMALAVDGSNDLYVAGGFNGYDATASDGIIRLNGNLTVDSPAAGTGINGTVYSILPLTGGTGDLLAAGEFLDFDGTASASAVRLNGDLTLDSAAAGSGITAAYGAAVYALVEAAGATGDIVAGGSFSGYDGTGTGGILRLNADTTRDASFPVGSGFDGDVNAVVAAVDGSGDFFVGGAFLSYNGTVSWGVIRLNADGSVDAAVSGLGLAGGVMTLAPAVDGSGDVFAGGFFTGHDGTLSNRIVRLNGDLTLDTAAVGAGIGGLAPYGVLTLATVQDGSGDLFVGGSFNNYAGTFSDRVIRLNGDLGIDTVNAAPLGGGSEVYAIAAAIDGSGDVFVGGSLSSPGHFIRLNGNLTADTYPVGFAFGDTVSAIWVADDGTDDVVVGGRFLDYNGAPSARIIRLNGDLSIDSVAAGPGFDDQPLALTAAPDGSGDLLVGGAFSTYDGTLSRGAVRLNDLLMIVSTVPGGGFNGRVNALATSTDGFNDVFAGGNFSTYLGVTVDRIVGINPNWSLD